MTIQTRFFNKSPFVRLVILSLMFRSLVLLPVKNRTSFQMKKVVVVEYFENCEHKMYHSTIRNFTFSRAGTALIFSGNQIIDRDSKDQIQIQFNIEKCNDKSNPDTCEYYTTWKWDNVCSFYAVMPFMEQFRASHTPPLSCPPKKGYYSFRNMSMESSILSRFFSPGDTNRVLWKLHIVLLEQSQKFACIDCGFRLATIRIQN